VLADRVAKPFLIFVLLAVLGAAAYWWRTDPAMALMAAVAVLVVTCPCALSLATPTAMLTTAGLLASRGVLVRRLQAIESLADVDSVIFDKTGTLTQAAMSLSAVHTRGGVSQQSALQWAASLARQSLHPVSRALVDAKGDLPFYAVENVKELRGLGLEGSFQEKSPDFGTMQGRWRLGSSRFCDVDATNLLPGRVHLADSVGWMASFEFDETLRPDAAQAVAALQSSGLAVYMLSGDTQASAMRVAEKLGIQHVQGNCTPETKLAMMKNLQAQGRKVLIKGRKPYLPQHRLLLAKRDFSRKSPVFSSTSGKF
jgi:Cu2+-exporting ATPase